MTLSGQEFDSEEFFEFELRDGQLYGSEFNSCIFSDCIIENSVITECRFNECTFVRCKIISNKFSGTSARGCNLDRCTVVGLNFSAIVPAGFGSPFDNAIDCVLKYCIFEKIDMSGTVFRGSDVLECPFTGCQMSRCDLSSCSLDGCQFDECNLQAADFRYSRGYIVDVRTCKVKDAIFSFNEAIHLLDVFGIRVQ